jgi:hypothetical protein
VTVTLERSLIVCSGGQTGVDRAALDVAVSLGFRYAGWCPRNGWAEDFPAPPGVLARYPALVQTPSADPQQRTAWNVRDSDATLILTPDSDLERSPGTAFTRACADVMFARPFRVALLSSEPAAEWLIERLRAHRSHDFALNVAGPRESEYPGVYVRAVDYLAALLQRARVQLS